MTGPAIDPRLVARLARVHRPGLIGLGLARRILGAVDALAGRLPLLARFPRAAASERDPSAVPIVHVVPAGAPAGRGDPPPAAAVAPPGRAAGTAPPVAPGRIVERRTERTIVERRTERTIVERVTGDDRRAPGGGAHRGPEVAAAPGALASRMQGIQRAAVDRDPGMATPAAAAALVPTRGTTGAASSDGAPDPASPVIAPRAVDHRVSPVVHAVHASAASAEAGDAPEASPSGAGASPRDARPPIVPVRAMIERVVSDAAGGGDGRGDARTAAGHRGASAAPTAPIAAAQLPGVVTPPVPSDARGRRSRMGAALVQRQAPQVAPGTAPVDATLAHHPGSPRPDLGPSRSAPRGVIVRARGVAPVAPSPSLAETATALPKVAPRRARPVDAPQVVTVVPRHHAVPPAAVVLPVVVPPQPSSAVRGTAGPPLAHLAAPVAAPTADRGGVAAPAAPRVEATVSSPHRPIIARGPAGPTPPPLDLRQIAAGVQQIFARQAEHERARRGIRR